MNKQKIIMHIDINGFFASAEQARKPELRGKAVLISANNSKSIVSALSVEAKKLGFVVGEPLFKQPKQPYVTCLPDLEYYVQLSERFMKLVSTYCPKLEAASIDECYIDATAYINKHKLTPYEVAKRIQTDILNKLHLPVSVGISTNKLVAKIAGEIDKRSMSIYILSESNVAEVLWPLHVGKLMMVGHATKEYLNAKGVFLIKDLVKAYEDNGQLIHDIRDHIGVMLDTLIAQCYGLGDDEVDDDYHELKGVQNEVSPSNPISTYEEISLLANELCEFVSFRLKEKNLMGSVIRLILKKPDRKKISMQVQLSEPTDDYSKIKWEIEKLINILWTDFFVRLVGVSVSKLVNKYDYKYQLKLDDLDKEEFEKDPLKEIIDEVNYSFGSKKLITLEQFENSPAHRNANDYEKRTGHDDDKSPVRAISLRHQKDKPWRERSEKQNKK